MNGLALRPSFIYLGPVQPLGNGLDLPVLPVEKVVHHWEQLWRQPTVVDEPPDYVVEWSIGLAVWAYGHTDGAVGAYLVPVGAAGLGLNLPPEGAVVLRLL